LSAERTCLGATLVHRLLVLAVFSLALVPAARAATGTVTGFPLPSGDVVDGMTAGPDGNLWFADDTKISRMTLAGAVTNYLIPYQEVVEQTCSLTRWRSQASREATLKRVYFDDQAEFHCTEARLLVEVPCRSIVGSHPTRYERRPALPQPGDYRPNELARDPAAARIGPNVELS
jgi:hypothetical protein